MQTQYFGIRHHGAGSARHLLHALNQFQPDRIFIEGPPEANTLLPLLAQQGMQPPVALLAYQPDNPQQAVYYPFAEFSPEWQALQYALRHHIPAAFFDLPLAHSLCTHSDDEAAPTTPSESHPIRRFPFDYLAEIAGYPDGESYWEALIEQRQNSNDIFTAIHTAMAALREHLPEATDSQDLIREAYMRKTIRQAEKEGVERLAVICGAWHVPALQTKVAVKDDNALLKGLPKCKIECTWIPWTHTRLTFQSGYGAGIHAPEWYAHLWQHPDDDGVQWIGRAATLLRQKNHDISAAHVIETVRLAHATAALRGQSRPQLADYTEAITTVMGFGDDGLLQLIAHDWLIGQRIGSVPPDTPQLPLIADVEKQRKSLKLPITAEAKTLTLDLRKPLDLQRSLFIHRLNLLGIHWATAAYTSNKGTFKEAWDTFYQPEQHIQLTERAVYGNTLDSAVCNYIAAQIQHSQRLANLTQLLARAIPADLPELVITLTERINSQSVNNHDINDILTSIPHLADIVRYGSVRQIDTAPLQQLLNRLLARLAAGGVQGCLNIDNDTAQQLFEHIRQADYQLALLDDPAMSQIWYDFIRAQLNARHVHPLLIGNAVRILFDQQQLTAGQTAEYFSQHLSTANPYADSASWLQGFLHEAGTVLLIHETLWRMVDNWVRSLSAEAFIELLPLLRRTFATFEWGERRQLGEKITAESSQPTALVAPPLTTSHPPLHEAHALAAVQTVAHLLGLTPTGQHHA